MKPYTETVRNVYPRTDNSEHISVVPSPDGLDGLTEIHQVEADGKISARIVMDVNTLCEMIEVLTKRYAEARQEENVNSTYSR